MPLALDRPSLAMTRQAWFILTVHLRRAEVVGANSVQKVCSVEARIVRASLVLCLTDLHKALFDCFSIL